jgi:transcription elongation factor GreA
LKEAKRKLEERIKKLEYELQTELPKALEIAIAMGDLRENAEYQTAKERQSYVQAELAQLQQRMSKLSLVNLNKIPQGRISYGSTVTLLDLEKDQEITYELVTSEESDVKMGLISTSSPIGKSLMGHEVGDEVTIRTPGGIRQYEVVSLTTIHEKEKS